MQNREVINKQLICIKKIKVFNMSVFINPQAAVEKSGYSRNNLSLLSVRGVDVARDIAYRYADGGILNN